jgi:hypothetical protein
MVKMTMGRFQGQGYGSNGENWRHGQKFGLIHPLTSPLKAPVLAAGLDREKSFETPETPEIRGAWSFRDSPGEGK